MKHSVTAGRLKRMMSERAKAIMARRGWTVSEVARRAGTASSNVYSVVWDSKGNPNVSTLAMVAKGLGCTVGHLLGEDPPESLSPAAAQTDEQMAEWLTAFREVDAETIADLRRDVTTLSARVHDAERQTAEANAIERARDGDISLMRGMVDELKLTKKTLLDKLENAARERRSAEQKYFVLAEACEKATESPTWANTLHGYVISKDNVGAIRRALNKNPLSDIPPANNIKAELADGTVLAKPANGAS